MQKNGNLWVFFSLIAVLLISGTALLYTLFKTLPADLAEPPQRQTVGIPPHTAAGMAAQNPLPQVLPSVQSAAARGTPSEAQNGAKTNAPAAPQPLTPEQIQLMQELQTVFRRVFTPQESRRLAEVSIAFPLLNKIYAQRMLKRHAEPADEAVLSKMWADVEALLQANQHLQTSAPETPVWRQADCASFSLPAQTQGTLFCRESDSAFCAFFEKNGQMFYCQTKDGALTHKSNIWGSSLTVTRADPEGRPLAERYYAEGVLTRAADFDYAQNKVSRFWWDENQIRFYQEDGGGKTLNKFYFRPGKPYIQYPNGNDMGERNGAWELKDNRIFTDGALLCTLPARTPPPDSCAVFAGSCAARDTQPAEELL